MNINLMVISWRSNTSQVSILVRFCFLAICSNEDIYWVGGYCEEKVKERTNNIN